MDVQSDFKELLGLLNARGVEYLIVGGYALAFHGAPRNTGDIDILVKTDPENARRIIAALDDFGFGSIGLDPRDFLEPEKVIQLGFPPLRVDLITSLTGVSWEEAFNHRVQGKYGGVTAAFIGKKQFIANKRATGRTKDLADIEALGEE